jgi:hypothetical protein
MFRKISLLAAGLLLFALNTAAAAPPALSADGSLVVESKDTTVRLDSGDTLTDIQTLSGQVHAYIFQSRTRVWYPHQVFRTRQTSWGPVSNPQLEYLISKYSRQYCVDPSLIRAVMRHESGFNPQAVSPKGAQGLMQLMPGTAQLMGVRNPFDPEQNIAGGVGYLRYCLDLFQYNVPLAVAAYNAGPAAVAKYANIPPYSETQLFVQNVLGSYQAGGAAAGAAAKKAGAKVKPKMRTAVPRRHRGPKIIELRPRKKNQTQAALAPKD